MRVYLDGGVFLNILWDFDGTLFNTYPAYTDILYDLLGGKVDKSTIYHHLKVSVSHAISTFQLSGEQVKEMKQKSKNINNSEMLPFPDVERVLQFADKNVIMTHKSFHGVVYILRHYGFEKYFSEIVTLENGFPRKPDIGAYQYLHTKYHIDLAIGDRELDLIPAKKLGIQTCMFQNTSPYADFSLSNYEEFFNLFHLESSETPI